LSWVHSYAEFQRLLELSLPEKIERAHMVIIEALQKNNVNGVSAVACSWGKDSVVLVHLVKEFCGKAFVEFNNTGVEYPQTLEYRDRMLVEWGLANRYVETHPEMSFWDCVEKYGYPHLRRMSKLRNKKAKNGAPACCRILKEIPDKKFCREYGVGLKFVGLQASESMVRRLSFLREGELYYSNQRKMWMCRPLMIWTDEDIWAYHELFDIPRNPLYDLMPRNGCMPCTGFKRWKEVMAKANPRLYDKVAADLGSPTLHNCMFTEAQ
jgi:phosphoadenosine phosphosulfate reductase